MLRHRLTCIYSIHQSIQWLSLGILTPVLILIFKSRDLNLADIGFIMGIFFLTTAAFEIPLGAIADNFCRIKIFLLSLLLNVLGLYFLLSSSDINSLIFSMIVLGISRAASTGSLDAWFYERFMLLNSNKNYHQAICVITFLSTLAFSLGALMGGYIPEISHLISIGVNQHSIYDTNILISATLSILLCPITISFFYIDSDKECINKSTKNIIQHSFKVASFCLTDVSLKWLFVSTLLFGVVVTTLDTFWQPHLFEIIDAEGSSIIVGYLSAGCSVASAISSLFAMWILKFTQMKHVSYLLISRLLSSLFFLFLAASDNLFLFSMFYVGIMLIFSSGTCSVNVLVMSLCPKEYLSSVVSILSFIGSTGALFTTIIFSNISENYGFSVSWIFCAIIIAVASSFYTKVHDATDNAVAIA